MALSRDFPATLREAIQVARRVLESNRDLQRKQVIETEAEQIVMAVMTKFSGRNWTRLDVFSHLSDPMPAEAAQKVLLWAGQRAQGQLLQHILGSQTFLNHRYQVGPEVLVPRPETEVLVDRAIQMLRKKGSKPTLGLEIGLGSGIISTELLAEFPTLTMWASELSTRAIELARNNCVAILGEGDANRLRILPVGESQLVCEPFLVELSDPSKNGLRADFLISNPPYLIESDEIEEDVKRQEPAEALFSPRLDDVYFYRKIALHFKELLRDDGFVLLELPSERAGVIRELFQQFEWKTEVVQDLNGRDRILVVTPPIT